MSDPLSGSYYRAEQIPRAVRITNLLTDNIKNSRSFYYSRKNETDMNPERD